MAAQTLKEALYNGVCRGVQGDLNSSIEVIAREVRDYLAHELYRRINEIRKNGGQFEIAEKELKAFLDQALKGIEATKGDV